jgi:hypothetical protein
MAEVLKYLNSFRRTFRTTKLLCLMDLDLIGSFLIGNSVSTKKFYLLYDSDVGHYNVITNIKAATAKKNMCEACDTLYDNTHKCDKTCSRCTATPPCVKDRSKYCGTCNRWFLCEKCFQNHLVLKKKCKLVCQRKQICRKCNFSVTANSKHECNKKCYNYCNKKTTFRPLLLRCFTANKQAF